VGAAAFSGGVGAERAVSVLAACLIRLGQAECARIGDHTERRWCDRASREQESARIQASGLNVRLELGGDLRAELESPVLLVLGVVLDEESSAVWVEFRFSSMTLRLTVSILLARSRSPGRNSASSPHRSPVSMAVSTRSWASAFGNAA
jgi:hypothetical protein